MIPVKCLPHPKSLSTRWRGTSRTLLTPPLQLERGPGGEVRCRRTAPWFVLLTLILAALACTSNDTLFIKLTATPVPSPTPTPLSIQTRFKVKDKPYVVGWTFQIMMANRPTMPSSQAAALATCFQNTQVEVLDVSRNVDDPKDTTLYYNIQCAASTGWVPEYWLTMLNPTGEAIVKSKDGKGAVLYSEPNTSSKPASETPCADGTKVPISGLTLNPDATASAPDTNIYVQVTCGNDTGYALESVLVPAE